MQMKIVIFLVIYLLFISKYVSGLDQISRDGLLNIIQVLNKDKHSDQNDHLSDIPVSLILTNII